MSDDDLPPLLDESELVQKIIDRKEKREIPKTNRELLDFETDEAYVPSLIKSELEPKNQTKQPEKKPAKKPVKKSSFGGFQDKAGFLSGKPKPKSKKQVEEIEEIITPKARAQIKEENPLILPEVQEQMKKELTNDDFLSSYENNEKLMRQMADPRFSRAIEFMQRDPAGCKEYYQKNDPKFYAELIEFFQENMKRIGGHMEKKGEAMKNEFSTGDASSPEEQKMREIMKRPDVQRALADSEIQQLLAELRNDPVRGQQRLSRLKPSSKAHVDTLIRNGLLQFQR